MLSFVEKTFRTWINAVLWINLIGFAITSGIFCSFFGFSVFLGVVFGIIAGFVVNILLGGFIANFLKMAENIEKIAGGKNGQNMPGNLEADQAVQN